MNNIDTIIKLLDSNWVDTMVERVVTYTDWDMYDSNNWRIKELKRWKPNNYYEIFFTNGLYMCLWDYVKFDSSDCEEWVIDRIKEDIEEMFKHISFDNTVKSKFIQEEVVDVFAWD